MKFVVKAAEPKALQQWRFKNLASPQNLIYDSMPKEALRVALLREQGRLCAYTMWRIGSVDEGHIEHVRPRSAAHLSGKEDASDIDYANLVYCYPGAKAARCEFGAQKKDNTAISPDTFVSPLDRTCQERFSFNNVGEVIPVRAADTAAKATIDLLGLNEARLIRARKGAIWGLLIYRPGTHPSEKEARQLARQALERDANDAFPEFAVALHQILNRYADKRAGKDAGFAKAARV